MKKRKAKIDIQEVLPLRISRIVSTGHPGVEQAALKSGFKSGKLDDIMGYCPKDYRIYKSNAPELKRFGVKPLATDSYTKAIAANVKLADVVIILYPQSKDSLWIDAVKEQAIKQGKLYLIWEDPKIESLKMGLVHNMGFLIQNKYGREYYHSVRKDGLCVYITGPRAHKMKGIESTSYKLIKQIIEAVNTNQKEKQNE